MIFLFSPRFIQKGDQLVLLLDYDGTLTTVPPNSTTKTFHPDSERSLNSLAHHSNVLVAIISGREAHDVKDRVAIPNITYSGNHGLQFIFANQTEFVQPIPETLRKNFTLLKDALTPWLINGARMQDKIFSMTYNYGDVPLAMQESYAKAVWNLTEYYGYRPLQAHSSIELLPIDWAKGGQRIFGPWTFIIDFSWVDDTFRRCG